MLLLRRIGVGSQYVYYDAVSFSRVVGGSSLLIQSDRGPGVPAPTDTTTKTPIFDPIGEDDSRDDHKASKLNERESRYQILQPIAREMQDSPEQ